MHETIRSFLAVELTDGLKCSLEALRRRIDTPDLDVRWVRPENIHLTLRFLGDVSERKLEVVCHAARNAARQTLPFRITLFGLGAFPGKGSPRVVWVGVQDPEPLVRLEKTLTQELGQLEWPPPDKPFRPHLTLGRVRSPRGRGKLKKLLDLHRSVTVGTIQVEHMALIKSELRSTGPIYTTLGRFPFCGDREQGGLV